MIQIVRGVKKIWVFVWNNLKIYIFWVETLFWPLLISAPHADVPDTDNLVNHRKPRKNIAVIQCFQLQRNFLYFIEFGMSSAIVRGHNHASWDFEQFWFSNRRMRSFEFSYTKETWTNLVFYIFYIHTWKRWLQPSWRWCHSSPNKGGCKKDQCFHSNISE